MSEGLSATANGNAAAGHQFSQLQVTSKFSWIEDFIDINKRQKHTYKILYLHRKGKRSSKLFCHKFYKIDQKSQLYNCMSVTCF